MLTHTVLLTQKLYGHLINCNIEPNLLGVNEEIVSNTTLIRHMFIAKA